MISARDTEIKEDEIKTNENQDDSGPTDDTLWNDDHHEDLLRHGPDGPFEWFTPTERGLVLGCGTGGRLSDLVEKHEGRGVVGIELSKQWLATAADKDGSSSVHVLRYSVECPPLDDDSFDARELHEGFSRSFEAVGMIGHCLMSSLLSVDDNVSPARIPHGLTTRLYDIESAVLNTFADRLAGGITGWKRLEQ